LGWLLQFLLLLLLQLLIIWWWQVALVAVVDLQHSVLVQAVVQVVLELPQVSVLHLHLQ
jgi:hypothetical protein